MDVEQQLVYSYVGFLGQHVLVNRKVIPESELHSVEQLLEPKWRGKMSWNEPSASGAGGTLAGYFLLVKGEEWLLKLYQQDVAITRDLRQQIEWVITNRYPIGIGPNQTLVADFRRQGFDSELSWLAADTPLGARLTTGSGSLALFDQAPHPNAARLFLNWLLSQEAQAEWVKITEQNSRRLDVPGPAETALNPTVKYENVNSEENQPYVTKAQELARSVFR
jgi:iron(III) transport system substrate-binding protein